MTRWAAALWVLGLVTWVPYGTHYLFFEASREQYPLLITLVLFWIFGYWGVVGPLIAAVKIRRLFRAIGQMRGREELIAALGSADTRAAAIEWIASENGVPRFVAARVCDRLVPLLGPRTPF